MVCNLSKVVVYNCLFVYVSWGGVVNFIRIGISGAEFLSPLPAHFLPITINHQSMHYKID